MSVRSYHKVTIVRYQLSSYLVLVRLHYLTGGVAGLGSPARLAPVCNKTADEAAGTPLAQLIRRAGLEWRSGGVEELSGYRDMITDNLSLVTI